MNSCPLYNGQNLNFTGKVNPYAVIQMGGKRKSRRRRTIRKRGKAYKKNLGKTRKCRR